MSSIQAVKEDAPSSQSSSEVDENRLGYIVHGTGEKDTVRITTRTSKGTSRSFKVFVTNIRGPKPHGSVNKSGKKGLFWKMLANTKS